MHEPDFYDFPILKYDRPHLCLASPRNKHFIIYHSLMMY